jgi:hypothetical protein
MTTTSHVLFFDSINIWNLEGLGLLRLALIATEKKKRGKIEEPAVIGAVLHLWYCCDFLDKRCIRVEYAEAFLQANKLNLEISEVDFDYLGENIFPEIKSKGALVSVMPVKERFGHVLELSAFSDDLKTYLDEWY